MKTKKLSFSEISGVMSRSEMKKIMAGSGNSACNWSCGCSDTVGSWEYTNPDNQPTSAQRDADIKAYCPTGNGYCERQQSGC